MAPGKRPSFAYHNADVLSSVFFGDAAVLEMSILLHLTKDEVSPLTLRFRRDPRQVSGVSVQYSAISFRPRKPSQPADIIANDVTAI